MNKHKIFKGIVVACLGVLVIDALVDLKLALDSLRGECGCDCCGDDDGGGNPCHMTCAGMAGENDFDDSAMTRA